MTLLVDTISADAVGSCVWSRGHTFHVAVWLRFTSPMVQTFHHAWIRTVHGCSTAQLSVADGQACCGCSGIGRGYTRIFTAGVRLSLILLRVTISADAVSSCVWSRGHTFHAAVQLRSTLRIVISGDGAAHDL